MQFNFPAFYRAEILNLTLSHKVERVLSGWSGAPSALRSCSCSSCSVSPCFQSPTMNLWVRLLSLRSTRRRESVQRSRTKLMSVLISSHALNRNNKVIHGRCPDFLFTAEASYKHFRQFDTVVKRLRASAASSSRPRQLPQKRTFDFGDKARF